MEKPHKDNPELEARLQGLSSQFNHPNKAYALLCSIENQNRLPEVETHFAALQQHVRGRGKNQKQYSIQLLVDYINGHPIDMVTAAKDDFGKLLQLNFSHFKENQSYVPDLFALPSSTRKIEPCPSLSRIENPTGYGLDESDH